MAIWRMELLKRLKFGKKSVEAAEEFVNGRSITG
jgi:hypothetical protein